MFGLNKVSRVFQEFEWLLSKSCLPTYFSFGKERRRRKREIKNLQIIELVQEVIERFPDFCKNWKFWEKHNKALK